MKNRPALVISVMDKSNPPRLRVAYGTTKRVRPVGKGQILLYQPTHLLQAGLASETRFSLLNLVVLDYNTHWFDQAPIPGGLKAATPKMGSLPAACMPDLQRAAKKAGLLTRERP